MNILFRYIHNGINIILITTSVFFTCLGLLIYNYCRDLPDYKQLENYKPALVSRLYSSEDQLINEQAIEYRLFTQINNIPKTVINAFISAEDKNFYEHSGLDLLSI
ncbi:MAG: hypothetical protein EOP34_12175 [Rickettsiales bacterium]|nr:MAG: hypothetical protein EOP34_12175 [Rickettsiales bacterium]